jgi:hypothetical protein
MGTICYGRIIALVFVTLTLSACATGPNGTPTGPIGSSSASPQPVGSPAGGPTASTAGSGGAGYTAIAVGGNFACVLLTGGTVKCWGADESGQLGNGTFSANSLVGEVIGLKGPAIAIRAGHDYACAIIAGGTMQCWGSNSAGRLGNGPGPDSAVAVEVGGLAGVTAFDTASIGSAFVSCAVGAKGAVECWGDYYLLGGMIPLPRVIPWNSRGIVAISVGPSSTTPKCALLDSGAVRCQGYGQASGADLYPEIYDAYDGLEASPIGLGKTAAALEGNLASTCLVTRTGGAKCWGFNFSGTLGDGSPEQTLPPVSAEPGTTTPGHPPTDVLGFATGATSVSVGWINVCAITDAGALKCWGSNNYGMLGIDSLKPKLSSTPLDVVGLSGGVVAVGQGDAHMCAITDGGSRVQCWGNNQFGQMGGAETHFGFVTLTPVYVPGL